MCIQDEWKLTVWKNPQPKVQANNRRKPKEDVELYNPRSDPFEKNNLVRKYTDRVAGMSIRLNEWWNSTTGYNKTDAGDGKYPCLIRGSYVT